MKNFKLVYFFLAAFVFIAGLSVYLWLTHDDCPSLCRAASVARQARSAMIAVEEVFSSEGELERSSPLQALNLKDRVSYSSPYVERWNISGEGEIVLEGFDHTFFLRLTPVRHKPLQWKCSGFPAKFIKNASEFLDRSKVGECQLAGPVVGVIDFYD